MNDIDKVMIITGLITIMQLAPIITKMKLLEVFLSNLVLTLQSGVL